MNTHKFDVEDAKKYGIEKAILLEHLKFHQQANEGNDELTFNGKSHAFLKKETLKKMYPYLSYKSVTRWLRELEDDGVIQSCKPKAKQGNHLKYYHVKSISQNETSKSQKQTFQISQNETSSMLPNEEPCVGILVQGTAFDEKKLIVDILDEIEMEKVPDSKEEQYSLLALHIWNDVNNLRPNNQTTLKAKIGSWYHPIRLMVEQDSRTVKEIWKLWKSIQRDQFWKENVLSTSKLREKFDQLAIKLEPKNNANEIIDALYG